MVDVATAPRPPLIAATLGETAGDLMTKSRERGGLDLGTIGSSAVLAAVLVVFVILEIRRERASEAGLSATSA